MPKIKTPTLTILLTLLLSQAPTSSFGLEQNDTRNLAIAGAVLSGISGCAGAGLAIHTYWKLSKIKQQLNKSKITTEEREAYKKLCAKIKKRYWIAGGLGALGVVGGIASSVALYRNRNQETGSSGNKKPKPKRDPKKPRADDGDDDGGDTEEEEEEEEGESDSKQPPTQRSYYEELNENYNKIRLLLVAAREPNWNEQQIKVIIRKSEAARGDNDTSLLGLALLIRRKHKVPNGMATLLIKRGATLSRHEASVKETVSRAICALLSCSIDPPEIKIFITKSKINVNARIYSSRDIRSHDWPFPDEGPPLDEALWTRPLHEALRRKLVSNVGCINALLDLGAAVNAREASGQTPLHIILNKYPPDQLVQHFPEYSTLPPDSLVKKLLILGADLNAKAFLKIAENTSRSVLSPAFLIPLLQILTSMPPWTTYYHENHNRKLVLRAKLFEEFLKEDDIDLALGACDFLSNKLEYFTAKKLTKLIIQKAPNRKFRELGRKTMGLIEKKETELNKKAQEKFDERSALIDAICGDKNKVRIQPKMDGDFEPIELPKSFFTFGL